MVMKTMTGEDLIAASVAVSADTVYTVPGYPVTSLGDKTDAEFVINEKTALEYAIGDSLAGKRSVVIVKNAGMNALADPLVITTTQGLKKGVLLIAGDDTGRTQGIMPRSPKSRWSNLMKRVCTWQSNSDSLPRRNIRGSRSSG